MHSPLLTHGLVFWGNDYLVRYSLAGRLKTFIGPGLLIALFIIFAGVISIIVSEYWFNGKYDYMIALVTFLTAGAAVLQLYYTRKEHEYRKVESFKDEIIVSILSLLKLTDFMDIIQYVSSGIYKQKIPGENKYDMFRSLIEICIDQCDKNLEKFVGCDNPSGLLDKYSKEIRSSDGGSAKVVILPKPKDAVETLLGYAEKMDNKVLLSHLKRIKEMLPDKCPRPGENESLEEYLEKMTELKESLQGEIKNVIEAINKDDGLVLSPEILKQSCLKCCYPVVGNMENKICR